MDLDGKDESYDEVPPDIITVKRRLMILWANSMRAELEDDKEADHREELAQELNEFIESKLKPGMTSGEAERHGRPLGTWSHEERIADSWDRQAGWPLLWALNIDELPAWDESAEWPESFDDVFDYPDPETWRTELVLRAPDVVEEMAKAYETRYWRMRTGLALENPDYFKKLLKRAESLGHLDLAPDGDLLLPDGRSLATVSEVEFYAIRSIQMERLYGLNWLCGQDVDWDMITADTTVNWLWDAHWQGRA